MFSSTSFILLLLPAIVLSSPISVPENGLTKRACSGVTVIFARGTTETAPTGTVVGPPLQSALKSALGSTTLEFDGVDYAASIQGAAEGGDPTGSQTMATDVSNALSACPSTKLVMSGYSQGAQLVHNAAKILGATTMANVSSVVTFGDPDQSQAVTGISPSKVKIFCASGDTICTGGFTITSAHLSYGSNAPAAASFIVSAAGL